MKTVILPGYSKKNKEWAEEMARKIDLNHDILVHNWRHWSEDKSLSFKYEIDKILKKVGEDKFNIISKSAGTRVALRLIIKAPDKINKVILTGFASTGDSIKELLVKVFAVFPTENLMIIQNTNDPYSGYNEVKKLVYSIKPEVKILKKESDQHHYPYPGDFEKHLEK